MRFAALDGDRRRTRLALVLALALGTGAGLVAIRLARAPGMDNPLRALVEAVARELATVRDQLERIYEDAFVSTCGDEEGATARG